MTKKTDTRMNQTKLTTEQIVKRADIMKKYGVQKIVDTGVYGIAMVYMITGGHRDPSRDKAEEMETLTGIPAKVLRPDLY